VKEWEDLIKTEFTDMDFTSRAVLQEYFHSLEYNWKVRSNTAHFPLFSDTTSNLQRSETLTRAFICRKKLLQQAKKTKDEDLERDCLAAGFACDSAVSPYEDFLTLSEAFFHATVMRTFLIAHSVRTMQKKRVRRKGHRRGGKRITKTRQKHKDQELKELATVKRNSKRSQSASSGGSQEDSLSQVPTPPSPTGELPEPVEDKDTAEKPRDDCCSVC